MRKKTAIAAGLLAIATSSLYIATRTSSLAPVGPVLSVAIYHPTNCEFRFVFRVPAGETNFPIIVGDQIICPSPSVPTAPGVTNPAPSFRFDVDVLYTNSLRITWPTQTGQTYRLIFSTDMKTWNTNPQRFVGDGNVAVFDERLDFDKIFYRVILE